MTRSFKSILLICVLLLQVTILAHFTPLNVLPNYILASVIAISIIEPEVENIVMAGISGALYDVLTGAPFGINTLLYIYIAILCVIVASSVYNKRVTVFLPVCFTLCFVYELLFGVFSCLTREASFSFYLISKIILPTSVANTLVFVFAYEILRRLRFEKKKRGIKYER